MDLAPAEALRGSRPVRTRKANPPGRDVAAPGKACCNAPTRGLVVRNAALPPCLMYNLVGDGRASMQADRGDAALDRGMGREQPLGAAREHHRLRGGVGEADVVGARDLATLAQFPAAMVGRSAGLHTRRMFDLGLDRVILEEPVTVKF